MSSRGHTQSPPGGMDFQNYCVAGVYLFTDTGAGSSADSYAQEKKKYKNLQLLSI